MSPLRNRRILITGGSRGIGAEIIRAGNVAGFQIAFIARGSPINKDYKIPKVVAINADLKNPAEAEQAVNRAAETLGGLDALINNAGTFRLGRVADGSYEDWRDMVDLNVLGLLTTTKASVPYLARSSNGQIINISSMSGRRVSNSIQGVYAGTKHAVHAISDGLRQELHGLGIRVTVISPGAVSTNYGAYITDPDVRAAAKSSQEKWGLDPHDVANQVLHVLTTPPDVHIAEIALTSARRPPR